ncbi:MAG TPA: hypothetical protein VGH48_01470 [Caldimonas sp.]
MNDAYAIGLAELSPDTRRRLDRDAWLLTAWWMLVGFAATALLHRVGGVRSPLWRYPLTALFMYALGDVAGLRAWLAVFARSARVAPARWRIASEHERADRSVSRLTIWFAAALATAIAFTGDVVRLLRLAYGDIVISVLVAILVVLAIAAFATRRLPVTWSSSVLMAELALDFVFGRDVRHETLPPRPRRESLSKIVGETWPRGVTLLVLAAVVAVTLVLLRPGAESLADAWP